MEYENKKNRKNIVENIDNAFYMVYKYSIGDDMRNISSPEGIKQKIAGTVMWPDYIRLLEYCKRSGKAQMDVVGQAVVAYLDRAEQEAVRE